MSGVWDTHRFWLFVASIALLIMGNVLRAARMTLLYPSNSRVRGFDLLLGLTLGYSVNALVPARLGELVRVLYVGKRCQIRYAYVAATVICERLSDALVLGLLCAFLLPFNILPSSMAELALSFLVACASGIAIAFLTKGSRLMRLAVWKGASIFNVGLCYGFLDLVWSYSELVTSRQMLRFRFLLLTLAMWVFYGFSYLVFGLAARASLAVVAFEMLGRPLHSMWDQAIQGRLAREQVLFLGFGVVPVFAILAFGLLRERNTLMRVCSALVRGHFKTWDAGASLVSEHFKEHSEYDFFLASIFAEDDQRVSGFGLNAIEDAVVHRIFQGGSGAITALVESDTKLMIRKFAIGDLMGKLEQQVEWLDQHHAELPLVEIVGERVDKAFYRYDMPYSPSANDFYDMIHTAPIEQSSVVLTDVITTINAFHVKTAHGMADTEVLDRYCAQKVLKNVDTVLGFISELIPGERYRLNGSDYSLSDWHRIQDVDWLRSQMRDRQVSQIHGDLTIENIIVDPTHPHGWYLIDPNPGNIFDSPFIDWAKLRQSLHLGYEGLNKAATCTLNGNELSIALTRSHAYDQLNDLFETVLANLIGPQSHQEVRFHELVNYLRLTPYKIRQSPSKGLTFFACTSILLASYLRDYN